MEQPHAWDDLEALVSDIIAEDPAFPTALVAAEEGRALMRRLYAARRAADISQATVAGQLGIASTRLARLERGWLEPTLAIVVKYAATLGLRVTLTSAAADSDPAPLLPSGGSAA